MQTSLTFRSACTLIHYLSASFKRDCSFDRRQEWVLSASWSNGWKRLARENSGSPQSRISSCRSFFRNTFASVIVVRLTQSMTDCPVCFLITALRWLGVRLSFIFIVRGSRWPPHGLHRSQQFANFVEMNWIWALRRSWKYLMTNTSAPSGMTRMRSGCSA